MQCSFTQVQADDSLAHALLTCPLQVSLYKQGAVSSRRHTSKHISSTAVPEFVGAVDVDLSALLHGRWAPLFTKHATVSVLKQA